MVFVSLTNLRIWQIACKTWFRKNERFLFVIIILRATLKNTHSFSSKWWKINCIFQHTASNRSKNGIINAFWAMKNEEKANDYYFFWCVCVFVNLDRQPQTTVFQNSVSYCVKARSRFSHYHNHKWVHAMTYKRLNAHDYMSSVMCSRKSSHSHYSNNNRIFNVPPCANCTHTHTFIYITQGFVQITKKRDIGRTSLRLWSNISSKFQLSFSPTWGQKIHYQNHFCRSHANKMLEIVSCVMGYTKLLVAKSVHSTQLNSLFHISV